MLGKCIRNLPQRPVTSQSSEPSATTLWREVDDYVMAVERADKPMLADFRATTNTRGMDQAAIGETASFS